VPKIVHNALTPISAKTLATKGELGRHADGGGLYLHVTGAGQAKWSLRFMLAGKSREMGLGTAFRRAGEDKIIAGVSLADARTAAKAARVKIDAGIDPLAEREAEEAARLAAEKAAEAAALAAGPARTFRAAFDGWLEAHGPAMKTERQRVQAKGLMARHVFPAIGDMAVGEITPADMLRVLQPIWRAKPETALRVRIRCEAVLAWAKAHGWRQGDNPAEWKDNLAPLLGRQGDAAKAEHHAAMDWRDLPAFMRRLEAETSTSALALRWSILNAARTNETLGATWAEIDMAAPGGPLWIIPAARMKMGVEHRVPLSPGALAVLDAARKLHGEDAAPAGFIFPGGAGSRGGRVAGGRPDAAKGGLSNMALLALLRRMKLAGECTPHGFRSTFRDWVNECTATPWAVAEKSLAHAVGDETERAYSRSDFMEKRRALMAAWSDYCAKAPAEVVALPVRVAG
jgi:integrase